MPCCQAASTVAAASPSGMFRNMLPNGAAPKPSGPPSSLSLMLMIPPRLWSRGLGEPSSLPYLRQAFRLDTASDRRPVVPRQTPGIPQGATFDRTFAWKGIAGPNPEALKIIDLRDERPLLGAASVGPIDM